MYELCVEADFAASHFLSHYHGKCENLHGHNYRVRVWLQGRELNEGGMVYDFAEVKKKLRLVLEELDHHHLNDMACFKNDPSAERLAEYIYSQINPTLPPGLLTAVDIFETPSSMARYRETP